MRPQGYIDDLTRFSVVGWAANLDDLTTPLRFGVFVNGRGAATITADEYRPGLEKLAEGASGRHAFKCYFPVPLSPYQRHEVELRCTSVDLTLRMDLPALQPPGAPRADDLYRPHGPILLTSGGRCGSTAIMEMLRRHPRIVVAGQPPYEIEMGCYYAHALRTLTATANHERSLRPDRITEVEQYYHIGFNPYLEPFAFESRQVMQEFVSDNVAGRVAQAFRGIILDYYQALARQQGKSSPAAFAEKSLPEPDSRLGIRYLFGNIREIVLVRDPRDVIVSFMSHGRAPFEKALSGAISTTRRCLQIRAVADEGVHFLRYEDFVMQPRETAEALFRFCGLAPTPYDDAGMKQLFVSHGTSLTPEQSIGRWRRELTAEQLEVCLDLNGFLGAFGYDATRQPSSTER